MDALNDALSCSVQSRVRLRDVVARIALFAGAVASGADAVIKGGGGWQQATRDQGPATGGEGCADKHHDDEA